MVGERHERGGVLGGKARLGVLLAVGLLRQTALL